MQALAWIAVGLSALFFGAVLAVALGARREVEWLAKLPMPSLPRWPRLSVITPARDEAERLPAAVRSRFSSDYPALELVVVDDRSSDGTSALADQLSAEEPRLRVVHLTELPAGWLGKVHALARGVEVATGEWLLFSDADVHFSPELLRRAVGYCEERGLDFLALLPDLWPSGWAVDAALSALLRSLMLGARPQAVADEASRAAVGSGVFNLVRRSALDRSGGFARLRMEVVDDLALAQIVKRSGGRCGFAQASGLLGLHFYRSLREMVHALEKNTFALLGGYRLWQLCLLSALTLVVEWSPLWACLCGGRLAIAGAGLGALDLAGAILLTRWLRRPWLPALLTPLGATIGIGIALRAGVLCVRRGGIFWRDTFYPLAALRAGRVFRVF